MYVTRLLSGYQKFPNTLSETVPDGPNSGFLVIQDEESETYSCYGSCKNTGLRDLPIPQNKKLTVEYVQSTGQSVYVSQDAVVLVPVLDHPLASNRYYAIKPHGKHKGEAITCSREEDMKNCCFCRCVRDIKPMPFDPKNIYQQIEINNFKTICSSKGYFKGKSVAEDGFPPCFLRRNGWSIRTRSSRNYKLEEALGIDDPLRSRLPDFNFPISNNTSNPVLVGRWYTPFMFIKEGHHLPLKDQLEQSMFYEICLEQLWEKIYTSNNYEVGSGKSMQVDITIETENVSVYGKKAWWDEKNVVDGTVYYFMMGLEEKPESKIGLRLEVVERMKWEQERGGWLGGNKERKERVIRSVEQFGGGNYNYSNNKSDYYNLYVLVERFAVRRMDGSVIMTYDFRHTHQIRTKWE